MSNMFRASCGCNFGVKGLPTQWPTLAHSHSLTCLGCSQAWVGHPSLLAYSHGCVHSMFNTCVWCCWHHHHVTLFRPMEFSIKLHTIKSGWSIVYFQWLQVITLKKILYSKTGVKRPLSKRPKMVFKTDYCLMQVKSIAECSKGSILQYFRPSLSYQLSLRPLFCLFWSGRFTQVLLY